MKTLDTKTQQRLIALAKKNLRIGEEFSLTIWMRALPIYRFISRKPLLRSFFVAFVILMTVLVTNLDKLDITFLAKQISLAFEVFIGFYAGFYFANTTDGLYRHLSFITLLPRDTFRRWFTEGISVSYGRINLLPNEARENYRFKDMLRNDKQIFVWFVVWHICIVPVFFINLEIPRLSLSAGVLAQYIIIIFWSYTWLWTPHYVIYGIAFLIKLAKLPVRYFYGIPDVLTLREVGAVVVRLNYLSFLHFLGLVMFLFVWEVIPRHPEAVKELNPLIVLLFLIAFVVYFIYSCALSQVIAQIAIVKSMIHYKKLKYAEYANHLETAFNKYMRQPTADNIAVLNEMKKNMKLLRKLPIFGLNPIYFIIILIMFAVDIAALYWYFKISFHGWENFVYLFRDYL